MNIELTNSELQAILCRLGEPEPDSEMDELINSAFVKLAKLEREQRELLTNDQKLCE